MKDRIIEKRGKKYLVGGYNSYTWIPMLVVMIMTILVMAIGWTDSPVDDQDSYYLKINDVEDGVLGYHAVGDLYQWESFENGGMHPTGEEGMVVTISDFVYREIERGNLISLVEDEDGNYQYAGDIYSSPSTFYNTDDFTRDNAPWAIILVMGFFILVFVYVPINRPRRIITIDSFNVCYKENRWYGKYVYGRAKVNGSDTYEMIRIESIWMFLNLDIDGGNSMFKEGGRFYTTTSRLKIIKDIDNHIEKLMDVEVL